MVLSSGQGFLTKETVPRCPSGRRGGEPGAGWGGPLSGSAVLAGPFLQPRVTARPVMNYGGFPIMPQFRKYFS